MKKLYFYFAIVIVASLFFAGLPTKGVSEDKIVWKLAHKMPPESLEGKGAQRFSDLVKEKSGGQMQVKIYHSEQLGKARATIEMLRAGTIDAWQEDLGLMYQFVPGFKTLALSFLYRDFDHWKKFMESQKIEEWKADLANNYNITTLGNPSWWRRTKYRTLVTTMPILSLSDLQGLKLRMMPDDTMVSVWKNLGANVMVVDWTAVYESLKRGIIEGVTSPFELVEPMKFQEVAKFLLVTDEFPQGISIFTNTASFRKLSPELQKIVEASYKEAGSWVTSKLDEYEKESLDRMIQKDRLTYTRAPMKEWRNRMLPVYERWEEKGELPDGILDYIDNIK